MKKIMSLILAVMLTMMFVITATAEERPSSGTIDTVRGTITVNDLTIENNKPVATYEIYQLLKLVSFDFNSGAYTYEYNDVWSDFFTTGAGKDYVSTNDKGLLIWVGSTDAQRVADFAKIALKYAEDNGIAPTKSTDNDADYTVSGKDSIMFSDLELGYYLVDSSVGALCGLSTTNPDGIINSKNGSPTIDKQVQEDLTQQWGDINSADIGQNVKFRTTIHVHNGAQNYVLHDIMEDSLTFNPDSVEVKLFDGGTGSETTVDSSNYSVFTKVGITETTDDDILDSVCDKGCTFEVRFTEEFCKTLETNDRLIIFYDAMLNRNAEIGNGTEDNPANQNKSSLEYGDHHFTTEDTTTTKTYGFDLVKTDGQNKLLPGAKFKIYDAETGGNEIAVVPLKDNDENDITTDDGYPMYRRARADETGVEIDVVNGKVRIVGLDNGNYWLEETLAPDGYNKIETRQKFTIADNNLDAIITNGIVSTNSGVQVINNTGSMLPETGATGTIIFIALGMIVVLGTGVLLVTKKRMSMIQD